MIDFTDIQSQYISFGTVSAIQGLVNRTLYMWVNFDTLAGAHAQSLCYPLYSTGTNEYWAFGIAVTSKQLFSVIGWSSASGAWSTNAAMTTGIHLLGMTYNNSSTSNDPTFYVDGASSANTESVAPSGTYRSGTTTTTFLGATNTGSDYALDGKVLAWGVYNRVFSTSDWADAYASKLAIPTRRGLVFAAQCWQRGEVSEGGTLTSAHTIADAVSGALGTPSGSPLHRQDNYLTIQG